MGIVYPDKDRVNETNKPMNSPTPKPGNIGIVYPPTPTRKNDGPTPSTIAQNQLNLMNSKNLAIPTSRSTPVETPMTALATVNKGKFLEMTIYSRYSLLFLALHS